MIFLQSMSNEQQPLGISLIPSGILNVGMKSLREYRIVAHVHDEVILEVPMETSLDSVCELMGKTPPWVSGLELRADGYECGFYQKA